MTSTRKALWMMLLCLLSAASARADVRLPSIFSDHMVLQEGVETDIWGWADPNEVLTIQLGPQTKSAIASAEGKWKAKLEPLKAAEALTLTVRGKNAITINDVLVGEVWLCSGQSNMGFRVAGAENFEAEKQAANHPKIRMFFVDSGAAEEPQAECKGAWKICTPETVGTFSATAYFFGREIHEKTGHAVGLINSSVGGTAIESWTSKEALLLHPEFQPIFEQWQKMQVDYTPEKAKANHEKAMERWKESAEKAKEAKRLEPRKPVLQEEPRRDKNHPTNLFNGKINPLIPYTIRGAIWYQGEHNSANNASGKLYGLQLETLIKDWRGRWGYDFPFGWVQLPDYHAPQKEPVETSGWVLVREGMLKTLNLPKTGMAVTLGTGEAGNIHPTKKQEVGRRLAAWALADVYGLKVAGSGPLPSGHEINGNEVTIAFTHTDGGLVSKNDMKGFAIAGEDKKFVRANAKIADNKVIVWSPDVPKPVAVRYAWAANPEFSLYNGEGLPATPFRTDDWDDGGK